MDAPLVALLLDMENVPASFIEPVADLGDTYGRVCHLAVYADWRNPGNRAAWGTTLDVGGVPKQIMKAGGANSADISIVVDAMELLVTSPEIEVFVLATGDSDFVPLIQKLRARGKLVVGAAPVGKPIRAAYESAFDRFERLREPGDEGPPIAAKTRAVPTKPTVLSLQSMRKALTGILEREGPLPMSEVGTQLRDALPGFEQKALGFRRLSDLIRQQSDLVSVVPDGTTLRVSLLTWPKGSPGVAAPPPEPAAAKEADEKPAEAAPPRKPIERADWTRLRDLLLAVLLGPEAPSPANDDTLVPAMAARAKRTGEAELPPTPVADIVAHYPSCFARSEDGVVTPLVGLVDAYKLRLGRIWEPLPRDVLRRGLALLATFVDGEPIGVADLPQRLAEAANGELTQAQARTLVMMVSRSSGFTTVKEPAGKPHLKFRGWLKDPAEAERILDEAALMRMGPFAPVDPIAMRAALGVDVPEPPPSTAQVSLPLVQ